MNSDNEKMPEEKGRLATYITELIGSDRETDGSPELVPNSREHLVLALEGMLVAQYQLIDYIRFLQRSGTEFRHAGSLSDRNYELCKREGVSGLEDADLARLLLDPPSLMVLQREIEEELPEAWAPRLAEEGRKLMHDHGAEWLLSIDREEEDD